MRNQKKLLALTNKQIEFITKISIDNQISFIESLRRILDEYIKINSKEK